MKTYLESIHKILIIELAGKGSTQIQMLALTNYIYDPHESCDMTRSNRRFLERLAEFERCNNVHLFILEKNTVSTYLVYSDQVLKRLNFEKKNNSIVMVD